jgi:hypothetical protein
LDKNQQPDVSGSGNLLARYQRVLRRLRLKHLLPWTPFEFGARWHKFAALPKASTTLLSEFEDNWGISLPRTYRTFLESLGNGFAGPYYGITPIEEWGAPENPSDLPQDFLRTTFSPEAPRILGLVPGAMRICNMGCDHYYLLVVSGPHTGEVWHDGGTDSVSLLKFERAQTGDASFAGWLEEWLEWISLGGSNGTLVSDTFWISARYPGHAPAQVIADLEHSSSNGTRTIAADQLPCPACVRLLLSGRVNQFIVPAMAEDQRRNPKVVARAAAQNASRAIPLPVFP